MLSLLATQKMQKETNLALYTQILGDLLQSFQSHFFGKMDTYKVSDL